MHDLQFYLTLYKFDREEIAHTTKPTKNDIIIILTYLYVNSVITKKIYIADEIRDEVPDSSKQ